MTSMLRRVKSRKGFTLTELIVVVAIVGLLMICVTAFVGPINKMVKATAADADAVTINEIAGDYIERRLAYANYIEMYVAANAVSGNGAMKSAYDNFRDNVAGADDTKGMLIFKMVEGEDNDNKSNTYRIYDVPMEKSAPGRPKTEYDDSFSKGLYPVFSDDFYGRYQHLILFDPASYRGGRDQQFNIAVNKVKGKSYINFDIYSYCFDETSGDDDDVCIKAKTYTDESMMEAYYGKIKDGKKTDTVFSKVATDQTAHEHISFELHNIPIGVMTGTDSDGNEVEVGVPVNAKSYYDGSGDDIVIFYNIPSYAYIEGLPK